MVRELERDGGVLLDEEYADLLVAVQPAEDVEDLAHDQRREAEGRLVEQQQPGPQHQRAADCQHLLFAAGQQPGRLGAPLLQDREIAVDHLHVGGDAGFVMPRHGAELKVVLDGLLGEGAAAVGHVGHAEADDVLGLRCDDGFVTQADVAGAAHHAADGAQRGAFAGAVGAEQGGDAAFRDGEIDAVQGGGLAVIGVQILDGQERAHAASAPR